MITLSRREWLTRTGAATLALSALRSADAADAKSIPIADAHSHLGVRDARADGGGASLQSLKEQLEQADVRLLAWAISDDWRWIRRGSQGIRQVATPDPGRIADGFRRDLQRMKRRLANEGLPFVRTVDDLRAAAAGTTSVVITSEGADFLEGDLSGLEPAWREGLRHLQLVHYIQNPVGDFQTEAPRFNGLSPFGLDLVRACNRLGILVDLAHSTSESVAQALEVSTAPMIWSHSQITDKRYTWRESGGRARRLHIDDARRIAAAKGAIGLWGSSGLGFTLAAYADELLRMVDLVGVDHVMIGSDTDGLGPVALINQAGDLRRIVDLLQARGVADADVRALCFNNYARCLGGAMSTGSRT